ncbi:MAG: hypothetical protein JXX28_19060 [Deltaproteobacteria bacterium]|nr:hypothetical protein [Deltaproteobacteria bacterium]
MSEIVARWEWRSFDEDFSKATEVFAALGETKARESEEIYILSTKSGDNTKIRFELMDIKTLRVVDGNGLQQWFPLMKSDFPLTGEPLAQTLASWGVVADAAALSYADFLAFVDQHPDLVAVKVTKRRSGWMWEGAFVELAEVGFDGKVHHTCCIEDPDADKVWRLVGELGMQQLPNVSYLAALKAHAGMEGA